MNLLADVKDSLQPVGRWGSCEGRGRGHGVEQRPELDLMQINWRSIITLHEDCASVLQGSKYDPDRMVLRAFD